MSEEQLSLRIRVIAATKNGLDKAISSLKGFASKVKSVASKASSAIRGFGASMPRINTAPALSALSSFSSASRNIMGRAFSSILGMAGKFAKSLSRNIIRGVKWAIVGMGAFVAWSLKTASWAEEMEGKFKIVFGKMAESSKKWAEDFAKSTGDSKYEIMSFMSSMQDLFVPMGFTRKAAADLAKEFTELGIDLASFNNVKPEEAMEKLQSALTGMYRPLRDMGVLLTDEKVKLKAVEMGLAKNTKNVTDMAMTYARLKLIQEQSSDAQGDAIRTSGSFANTMKAVRSAFKDLRVEVGKQLVEGGSFRTLLGDIAGKIKTIIQWLKDTGAVEKWGKKLKEWLTKAYESVKPIAEEIGKLFSDDSGVREKAQKDLVQKFSDLGKTLADKFVEIVVPALIKAAMIMARAISYGIGAAIGLGGKSETEAELLKDTGIDLTQGDKKTVPKTVSISEKKEEVGLKEAGVNILKLLGKFIFWAAVLDYAAKTLQYLGKILTPFYKILQGVSGELRALMATAIRLAFYLGNGFIGVVEGIVAAFSVSWAAATGVAVLAIGSLVAAIWTVVEGLRALSAKIKFWESEKDVKEQEAKYGSVEQARARRKEQNRQLSIEKKYGSGAGLERLITDLQKQKEYQRGGVENKEKLKELSDAAQTLIARDMADKKKNSRTGWLAAALQGNKVNIPITTKPNNSDLISLKEGFTEKGKSLDLEYTNTLLEKIDEHLTAE